MRAELERAPPRHRGDQDPRPGLRRRLQALAPEGHRPRPRRLDALADLHRRRHRLRPALRAPTPSRSTARSAARRCAARCRCTPSAGRSRSSTRPPSSAPSTKPGGRAARRLGRSRADAGRARPARRPRPALSFRNIARVAVLPARGVGVADIVGAASLLVSAGRARRADRARRGTPRGDGGGERLMEPTQVIIRPVVSEKSYVLAEAGKYTFRVHDHAHKTQIRQAVEAAVRRPRRRGPHRSRASPSPSAAADRAAARASGRRRSCRCARARRSRSSAAWRRASSRCRSASPSRPAPGRRFVSYPDFAEITRTEPERSLVEGLKKTGGRNAHGRKTSRHRGGGAKRLYRMIDFKRRKDGVPAQGRARSSTTPTAPPTSRCCTTPTARSATSSRPQRLRVGMTVAVGRRRRHPRRQLPAAREHADRHRRPQRRADPGPRRPAGALRRRRRPADGQGRRLWRRCACPPARCAWSAPSAAPPSA